MVEAAEEKPPAEAEAEEVVEDEPSKEEEEEKKLKFPNLKPEFIENLEEVFAMFIEADGEPDKIPSGSLEKLLQWNNFNPTQTECAEYTKQHARNGYFTLNKIKLICDEKMADPDSFDQTVEALKLFDSQKDGKLDNNELRYYLQRMGNMMGDEDMDDLIKELDPEKSGVIDLQSFAKCTHNIKDENAPTKKKKGGDGGGKKKKK